MSGTGTTQRWQDARGPFALLFGAPALWLLLFFLVPLAIVWAYSFGRPTGLTDIAITGTLSNYARAIEPLYLGIFVKSIGFAALTTVLCLVIGFPVALVITFASERAKALLLLVIMLPFWTNLLIRTYALMAMLAHARATSNTFARLAWPIGPFCRCCTTISRSSLGLVYVNLPFMVLPLYSALDRLDRSLLEASLDLGAGHWRTIREIVVPLALPGILSGVLITFIPALGAYLTPDLLGGPDSQMIANVIERQFKRANDWPFGAALSFMLMYLTFICIAGAGLIAAPPRER